jgi:hypothetical protein
VWTGCIWLRTGIRGELCEYSNEECGSKKVGNFKNSAPRSYTNWVTSCAVSHYNKCGPRYKARVRDIPAWHGKGRDILTAGVLFCFSFFGNYFRAFSGNSLIWTSAPLGLIYMAGLTAVASQITQGKWGSSFAAKFWRLDQFVPLLYKVRWKKLRASLWSVVWWSAYNIRNSPN